MLLGARPSWRSGGEEFAEQVEGDVLRLEQGLQEWILKLTSDLSDGGLQPTNSFFDVLWMRRAYRVSFAVMLVKVAESFRIRVGESAQICDSSSSAGERTAWLRFSKFCEGNTEACATQLGSFGRDWRGFQVIGK